MAKPHPVSRKSERSKVVVAVVLAVVLVIVLVSQFGVGDRDLDNLAVMPVVGGSSVVAQTASKASPIQSKATNTQPDIGSGAANRVKKTIGDANSFVAYDAVAKAAPVSQELPKIDHDAIGQNNPFYEQTELPVLASMLDVT